MSDTPFGRFLTAMREKHILHLGHRDADCDALGSAYAMSRLLPGDIGFATGMKVSASDLAAWLEVEPVIDPDPEGYDYTIIYDTPNPYLLAQEPPSRFALFDHHVRGGHRYSDFENELAPAAEWSWVRPVESTCSLLVDLFQQDGIHPQSRAAIALAAGIVTDTAWLRAASSAAFQRLGWLFEPHGYYLEDVLQAIDPPRRQSQRRGAVLAALRNVREWNIGVWSILGSETDCLDHGFALTGALRRLGGHFAVVAFPRGGGAMALVECAAGVAKESGAAMDRIAARVADDVGATDHWGTGIWGRVVAPLRANELLDQCVRELGRVLLRDGM